MSRVEPGPNVAGAGRALADAGAAGRRATSRDEELSRTLEERLSREISVIRARMAGVDDGSARSVSQPGTGSRLDICA